MCDCGCIKDCNKQLEDCNKYILEKENIKLKDEIKELKKEIIKFEDNFLEETYMKDEELSFILIDLYEKSTFHKDLQNVLGFLLSFRSDVLRLEKGDKIIYHLK